MQQLSMSDDVPKCSRCFLAYTLDEKEPRVLPVCGHSICKKCLMYMLRTASPLQIKCPQCPEIYKFKRTEILSLDKFPVNNDLVRIIRSQIQHLATERCRRHDRESNMFCFDPECRHKNWACLLCIRDHHKNCKEQFIVQKSELGQKVSFTTNSLNVSTIKENLKNEVRQVFGDFEQYFMSKADSIAEQTFRNTEDLGTSDLSQLSRHLNQLSIVHDSVSKKIVIKRKDEERLAEQAHFLEQKVSSFLYERLNSMFNDFVPSQFEFNPKEMRYANYDNGLDSYSRSFVADSHLNFEGKYKRIKEHIPLPNPRNVIPEDLSLPPEHAFNSDNLNEMLKQLPANKYVVLEFTDKESLLSTRSDIMDLSNLVLITLTKPENNEIFADQKITTLPTFVCFSKNQNVIHKFKLINPDENLLINTLVDLSLGLLTNRGNGV